MVNFVKKLGLFACLLMFSGVIAEKTKKLQLLIDASNPAYFFALNAGNGIVYSGAAPRPQGSYYVTNAFIFPGGTVNKDQSDFSVDKHGNPINFDDNIGIAYIIETMLQTFDFNNLPPAGTVLEASQFQLQFKHKCDNDPNSIFATGFGKIETISFGQGQPSFKLHLALTSGLGCNQNPHHNNFTAKVYLAGLTTLITIKFDEEIEYKS